MIQPPRLLVVDDEAIHRKFIEMVLPSADWTVDSVADGHSALRAIENTAYCLVLLDIRMPGLDGFDTALTLRERGDSVPILAFTSLRGQQIIDRIVASGMDGYLVKPCTPEKLIEAVQPWRPASEDGPAKLVALLGEKQLAPLVASFRAQLADALDLLGTDGDVDRAHRIGGIAGTLGYHDASEAWLALSEGDLSAVARVRLRTRKALHAIDRRSAASARAESDRSPPHAP